MAKGNFIEYVVSDNPNKYPNGGEQGGYLYEIVEDVTPEVTAQTPVITQIAENLGVTITTPSGTNKQILQGNNANLQTINTNFIGTQEKTVTPTTAGLEVTPDSGYLLNKVIISGESDLVAENIRKDIDIFGVVGTLVEGVAGIDFGEVTLTSTSSSVTFNHNLGVAPSFAAFIPKDNPSMGSSEEASILNVNGLVLYRRGFLNDKTGTYSYSYLRGTANVTLTETTVSFDSASSYKFKKTTYYWIAIV